MKIRNCPMFALFLLWAAAAAATLVTASVKGPPEVTLDYLERYVAVDGDTVKLICPITGSPRPMIEWYQDDHLIGHSWDRYRLNRRFLKIRETSVGDSGVYVCKGINGFGSQTVALNLVVKDFRELERLDSPPLVLTPPSSSPFSSSEAPPGGDPTAIQRPTIVHRTEIPGGKHLLRLEGDTLKLECFVDGNPPPSITWYKNEDILMTGEHGLDRTQTTLLIPNVAAPDDAGDYRCKAMNMWGEAVETFPVRILESIPIPEMLGPEQSVVNIPSEVGSSEVALSCEVLSLGPTQVQWLRKVPRGQEPSEGSKSLVVLKSTFEILTNSMELTRDPAESFYNATLRLRGPAPGRYVCMANNPQGHAYKEVTVSVGGAHAFDGGEHHRTDVPMSPSDSITAHIPLALVISVPLTSLVLLSLLLIFALCLRRQPGQFQKADQLRSESSIQRPQQQQQQQQQQQPEASYYSVANAPSLHINPMCSAPSPYATSLIAQQQQPQQQQQQQQQHEGSISSGSHSGLLWRSPKMNNCESGSGERNKKSPPSEEKQLLAEDELDWVEVTNKGNQTPNHWVYSDMISGNSDLVYPLSNVGGGNTFNTYIADYSLPKERDSAMSSASASMANSPLMLKRKPTTGKPLFMQQQRMFGDLGMHISSLPNSPFLQRTSSQPGTGGQLPMPPPYTSHVYANHLHSAGATPSRTPPSATVTPRASRVTRDSNPEFFVVMKQPMSVQQQMAHAQSVDSGRDSQLSLPNGGDLMYARPPSDHIYFKINEGQSEFV